MRYLANWTLRPPASPDKREVSRSNRADNSCDIRTTNSGQRTRAFDDERLIVGCPRVERTPRSPSPSSVLRIAGCVGADTRYGAGTGSGPALIPGGGITSTVSSKCPCGRAHLGWVCRHGTSSVASTDASPTRTAVNVATAGPCAEEPCAESRCSTCNPAPSPVGPATGAAHVPASSTRSRWPLRNSTCRPLSESPTCTAAPVDGSGMRPEVGGVETIEERGAFLVVSAVYGGGATRLGADVEEADDEA